MVNSPRIISIFVLASLSSYTFGWSNYFRFVNNFDKPLSITITPEFGNVNNQTNPITELVPAHASSAEYQFDTAQKHWNNAPENNGFIKVTKDSQNFCLYQYHYTYQLIPYSYFDLHSENVSLNSCSGTLKSNEIMVINDHNQALPRPMVGTVGFELTESLSQHDCGEKGGDNCLIASPDLNTVYQFHGSTLSESLELQNQLDKFEPLNFEQFIGSHNSAISQRYTTSTSALNLSHADPDSFLTLTEQLNSGIRQIELDIQWLDNDVKICHDNASIDPSGYLCEGNVLLKQTILEIKNWVQNNPNKLLFIYLDVHKPLVGHVQDLDTILSDLNSYIFTPSMAKEFFQTNNNSLPAWKLTQDDLIKHYKKSIIIVNDDDRDNLKQSQYVFVSIDRSPATPLTEVGVDTFFNSNLSDCRDMHKYEHIKKIFSDDSEHYNLLRINAGRTVLNYVSSAKNKSPDQYSNYFTTNNLQNMLNCPVNVFSTSTLGFTCDTNACLNHPTDPKLYNFLWSWTLGYPLKSEDKTLAYVNPKTHHIENDPLTAGKKYAVLCLHPSSPLPTPTQPFNWYSEMITLKNSNTAFDEAKLACKNSGGIFTAPTTSYWMHDVLFNLSFNEDLLINYEKINGEWIANEGKRLGS